MLSSATFGFSHAKCCICTGSFNEGPLKLKFQTYHDVLVAAAGPEACNQRVWQNRSSVLGGSADNWTCYITVLLTSISESCDQQLVGKQPSVTEALTKLYAIRTRNIQKIVKESTSFSTPREDSAGSDKPYGKQVPNVKKISERYKMDKFIFNLSSCTKMHTLLSQQPGLCSRHIRVTSAVLEMQ